MRLAQRLAAELEEFRPGSTKAGLMGPLEITAAQDPSWTARDEVGENAVAENVVILAQTEIGEARTPSCDPERGDPAQLNEMGKSLERIRQTVALLRASDTRTQGMVAALELANERARSEIEATNARLESAEMRAASEAARADAAEQRCRDTEVRFGEILNNLADELESSA